MIDELGVFVIISTLVYTTFIYIGYWIFEDFDGIMVGVALAAATLYLLRNPLIGIAISGGGS